MGSLAQQLKALAEDVPKPIDPDSAYADLDGLELERKGDEGREHYLDVGPSRLRNAVGDAAQTLLSDKYGGNATSRMKIFDDDEEEDEAEEDGGLEEDDGDLDADEEDGEEEDDEDEDDYDEDEDDDDEDEDEDEDDDEDEQSPRASSSRALDPVGHLREARQKDIVKGRGIKRQRDLFDTLLTLRITFQKALTAGYKVPPRSEEPLADDPAGEVDEKRIEALKALGSLSDTLFSLREKITLPDTEAPRKRRRTDSDVEEESYWTTAAADSFALVDASHPLMVPILNKWSTKIQTASLQLGSKHAGGSKFMQAARGPQGVVDAIDASLAQKRENPKPLIEDEETGYRALLREVIESRQGGGGTDLMHLRREKKKKREAERGGSKGRKLRYTVHEKAANFVVPIPLEGGWHEEQIDELFSSLFGGVGLAGAMSSAPETNGATDLGGLRVF